jgi:hypothetical protein
METAVAERPRPNLTLIRHQAQMFNAPWNRQLQGIDYFLLIAGYGSGKTYLDCASAINLIRRYHAFEVIIGIGGPTRIFLEKTLLHDLFRMFDRFGIPYDWNTRTGIITVDKMQFMCIGTDQPELIYGYNYHAFLWDEPDELPFEKCIDSFKAIHERTRVVFPDGRQPFFQFSSTAQGYKGLFQVVTDLQEKREPHMIVRGESITAVRAGILSRVVFERWNRLYTANEKLAFLEGRFVNLTTGRVYYEYDETINRLKTEPFKIQPEDVVWVGQDLNAGFSRGTAYILRTWADPRYNEKPRPTLFIVKTWSFREIGHAPKMMRSDFLANEIIWYPDATGKEIIAGYRAEMREHEIEMRTMSVNPNVVDRIFVMNKLFAMRKLYLFPNCGHLSMSLKVRQYNENGDPEKGKGPDAPDHDCDSAEYAAWRIVRAEEEFFDIYSATGTYRREHRGIA